MSPATALACQPSAIARARSWAADIVGAGVGAADLTRNLCQDVVLCVSELVTNALQAGCGEMTLRIDIDDKRVRVLLSDDAPGAPVRRYPDASELRGRGLMFVENVAARWGVDHTEDGKTVWADFPRARS